MEKKKLAIIGTVGVPACYGGFETLAEHLLDNLSDEYKISVYCSGKKYPKEKRKAEHKGAKLIYLPFNANGITSILYDTISIIHAMFTSDVLMVLGVAGAWVFPFIRLFTNKKIIVSIDGIEWKRSKWNRVARWYLWWAEGIAVKFSHADISDNESIQDYTAKRYGSLSNVIEYGADHTMNVAITEQGRKEYPFLNSPYAFKVCRIEPENNVHVVIDAFSRCEIPLVMVGNWNNSEYGKSLRNKYASFKHIHLLDPIYNQEKLDMLRGNCSLYVHGHSAGGTNPSLVEAMALGLPIFSYDVSYNRTTTENRAKYFSNAEQLLNLLQSSSKESLEEMGKLMKKIAGIRYTWKVICRKYNYLIQTALDTKEKNSIKSAYSNLAKEDLALYNLEHLKYADMFYNRRRSA
jgi:glycosyltransferase involved in cell wall biosynthesis